MSRAPRKSRYAYVCSLALAKPATNQDGTPRATDAYRRQGAAAVHAQHVQYLAEVLPTYHDLQGRPAEGASSS